MPVPKRKMSRSKTRSRRANWKASATNLITVNINGINYRIPHSLVKAVRLGHIDPSNYVHGENR
jgi:large subunit ribosomal protein L32